MEESSSVMEDEQAATEETEVEKATEEPAPANVPSSEETVVEGVEKPLVEEIKEEEAEEEEEIEVVEERTHLVPFGKVWRMPREKRAPKAMRILKEYVERHMKVEDVAISNEVNEQIWAGGITNPPRKLRVRMVKDKEGRVTVYPAKGE